MSSFLDKTGLTKLWDLIKSYIDKNHPKYEILGNVDDPNIEIETPNFGGGDSTGGDYYIMPDDFIITILEALESGSGGSSSSSTVLGNYTFTDNEWNKFSNAINNMKFTDFIFDFSILMKESATDVPIEELNKYCMVGDTLLKMYLPNYSDGTDMVMFTCAFIESGLIKIMFMIDNTSETHECQLIIIADGL